MEEKKVKKSFGLFLVVMMIVSVMLSSCSTGATTTASCAFMYGTGYDGHDTKLDKIIYPGQDVTVDSYHAVSYFPCNSRNYIINDGTIFNANGEKVGDRGTLIQATTSTGVKIKIGARALWTLNQAPEALTKFYDVCFKYQCASAKDVSGDANFSTPGWNGMLAENFGPAMDTVAKMAAYEVDDSIWKTQDPAQYKALGDKMSAYFADVMRANLGYPVDLFCGSGNSSWSDPTRPGEGAFNCMPVRIQIDSVEPASEMQTGNGTEGQQTLNEQRLENAKVLYGPNAGWWLALQDTIEKCNATGANCTFIIGDPTNYPPSSTTP